MFKIVQVFRYRDGSRALRLVANKSTRVNLLPTLMVPKGNTSHVDISYE